MANAIALNSILDSLKTLSLADVKTLEASIKEYKATLKELEKSNKESNLKTVTDKVNEMISNGTLKVGMDIVVLYGSKNEKVVGKIVGVLNTDKKSITVESDKFVSAEGGVVRRYIDKARFVEVAEVVEG